MTGETIGLIFAVGVVCAALYDFFRAAHTLTTRHTASVVISDVLYWLIVTAGVIYSLWKINDIKVGLYETAALLTGAALYFMLASAFIYRLFFDICEGCGNNISIFF